MTLEHTDPEDLPDDVEDLPDFWRDQAGGYPTDQLGAPIAKAAVELCADELEEILDD